jgi:hypothetical protein
MSLSVISASASMPASTELQKAAPVPIAPQSPVVASKPDSVTISASGHAASRAGDADGDGR